MKSAPTAVKDLSLQRRGRGGYFTLVTGTHDASSSEVSLRTSGGPLRATHTNADSPAPSVADTREQSDAGADHS